MLIPIQNIYFLLCYAWDALDESEITAVDSSKAQHMPDLLAKVLLNGCKHLLKIGLDCSYIHLKEERRGIKGKIFFSDSLNNNSFQRGAVVTEFDDHHYNILHNQILKASLKKLNKINELDPSLKQQISLLLPKFYNISDITLQSQDFASVKIHRNNYYYGFLLNICQLIHENILINEQEGKFRFKNFFRDERKMPVLFEKFVRNFLNRSQDTYKVSSETIHWNTEDKETNGENISTLLPVMRTDISLDSPEKKIIIDTKYYRNAFSINRFQQEKFNEKHLYQLFAYIKNLEALGGNNTNCEGILLYPAVNKNIDFSFKVSNHIIRIKSIDLNKPWQEISADLLGIVHL